MTKITKFYLAFAGIFLAIVALIQWDVARTEPQRFEDRVATFKKYDPALSDAEARALVGAQDAPIPPDLKAEIEREKEAKAALRAAIKCAKNDPDCD